ncbi:glyoxalase [Nakamurella silvestris]|nr:glyoxalase [Nakamurella silvestris]
MSGSVHHIELWVPDFAAARPRWHWLLTGLGWVDHQDWPGGHSWKAADDSYLVIEESPDLTAQTHDRTRPGLNHLAFWAGSRSTVDDLARQAPDHGWQLLFGDSHPYAGGPAHYAAFLADTEGYEVEIVAKEAG